MSPTLSDSQLRVLERASSSPVGGTAVSAHEARSAEVLERRGLGEVYHRPSRLGAKTMIERWFVINEEGERALSESRG